VFETLFITHAGSDIGGGHLSRCLALSQGLAELGARNSWILNDGARSMAAGLGLSEPAYIANPFGAAYFRAVAGDNRADLVVVDSYTADGDFFALLSESGHGRILTISDFPGGAGEKYSSILVDYSVNAPEKPYDHAGHPDCKYLLGPGYTLLRKDFWNLKPVDTGSVLLIPGAADVAGVAKTFAGWWRDEWPPLIAVCGPLVSPDEERLIRSVAEKKQNVSVRRAPENLPELMAGASFIVCSASVVMHEALALGKKTAVFVAADNQIGAGEYLGEKNVVYNLGLWRDVQQDEISKLFNFQPDRNLLRDLVNPAGALRCAGEVLELLGIKKLIR
jgi:UDP-2,4-diacetamido-2,4,6-trideoxy-beta-L-altropyranose hydrolase